MSRRIVIAQMPTTRGMDPAFAGGVLSQMRVSRRLGGVTEWLMVADCKSAGLTPYVGSNPTPTIGGTAGRRYGGRKIRAVPGSYRRSAVHRTAREHAGVAQLVEHQPSKLRVAGSSPVARFEAELTL